MKVLTISGSSRPESHNTRLLKALPTLRPNWQFKYMDIGVLPLFKDTEGAIIYPDAVQDFKNALSECNALIISTPEYIHNIPAQLKNALEWITASGELAHKTVLPLVFAPHAPRGEKAMISLLNSLKAMHATIPTHMLLYQQECQWNESGVIIGSEELLEILNTALDLFE